MKDFDTNGCHFPLFGENSYLVGNLPWFYGTEYTNFLYRAEPEEVAKFLPYPLEPSSDPGICYLAFSKWISLSSKQLDMPIVNPERTQYKEVAIWAGCSYKGKPGQICLYIWVDKDFSMARGWLMGFPKRFGQIEISEYQPRNPRMNSLGNGSKIKCFGSSNSEILFEGKLMINENINATALPYPFGSQVFNIRYFPSIEKDSPPSILDLVELGADETNYGEDIWEGEGSLRFLSSSLSTDHLSLKPIELLGAYHYSSGYTFNGGKVLYSWV